MATNDSGIRLCVIVYIVFKRQVQCINNDTQAGHLAVLHTNTQGGVSQVSGDWMRKNTVCGHVSVVSHI